MKFTGRCKVIAEVAQAHDGSLGHAHAFIDAAAAAKVDAVKFQCHIAREESTLQEPWRVQFSRQDATRYDYWKRMEFTEPQWTELKRHCDESGVEFLCSPFSVAAVELLLRVGVQSWKVASGEIATSRMLEAILASKLPTMISSGMASWSELDAAVNRFQKADIPILLFQCTTQYPTPPERVGLNIMREMRERYGVPVGLSDHSGEIYAGLAAAALGAKAIEVHIAFSKQAFGPDVPASLIPDQLANLVNGVHAISTMLENPVDKDSVAMSLSESKRIFAKSLVARSVLPAGAVVQLDDLAEKKPGTGIPAELVHQYVGRKLKRDIRVDQLLTEDDFE